MRFVVRDFAVGMFWEEGCLNFIVLYVDSSQQELSSDSVTP